ncbi:MAG: hypothetical protein JWQ74_3535 [Marmoricola sp.]|nr:hypothetical protein [Marmoricola sp.]
MKQKLEDTCPQCRKFLSQPEFIDQWCETCERATDKPAEHTKARAAA